MRYNQIFLLFAFFYFLCCQGQDEARAQSSIVPKPNSIVYTDDVFVLNQQTGIRFPAEFAVSGNFLTSFINKGSGFLMKRGEEILFRNDSTIAHPEGYVLDIAKEQITISAATDQGAFYAVQSLRQLLPARFESGQFTGEHVAIETLTIKDAPRFTYRGMHLDVGRHLFSVDFIKKYISALALLKFNTFHWHLTEDQGWRIESKKYPKLNTISSFRDETLIGHFNQTPQQFDGKRYGGFYTQDEIREVVAFAKAHHITIIPEIEMPGHSQAVIAAYPRLGCTDETVEVATKWGVFNEIFCTKEKTFTFLEGVLDEVMGLFPGSYIHIGGDEAPKERWEHCAVCQKRMLEEGLSDTAALQSYFIERIEKYINGKGRKIVGWDEILEGGLAPNATVMSWRGLEGGIEAAKAAHQVIMTPTSHTYFDYYQSQNSQEPLAIGGYLPLEKVYSFDPVPEELSKEEAAYIIGAQGNVWTEYMPTSDKVEYMVFPRILAMSEVTWTQPRLKELNDFYLRTSNFFNRLEALEINYANHLYDLTGHYTNDGITSCFELQTPLEGMDIRYTTNGDQPTIQSKKYDGCIPLTTDLNINATVFENGKKVGTLFQEVFDKHQGVGASISLNVPPHEAYNSGGKIALINGITGSDERYGDSEWLGFYGEDVTVRLRLPTPTQVNYITTRVYNAPGQWIYAPKEIHVLVNEKVVKSIPLEKGEGKIVLVTIPIDKRVHSLSITFPNYGEIPEGLQGAGNRAWTFIDEIKLN